MKPFHSALANPIKLSFAVKLIALTSFTIFLSVSLVASFTYLGAKQRLIGNLGEQLQRIVQTTAPLLDPESHENIYYDPEIGLEGKDNFTQIQTLLTKVRDSNHMPHHNGLSPIYTLRKSWQFEKNNMLEFVVMTDPDESGRFYTGALYKMEPFHLKVFNGEVMTTDIYYDNEGAWLSAAAPIVNHNGKVIAILQADRRVDFVLQELVDLRNSYLAAGLFSLMVGVILSLLFAWRTTKPIKKLVDASIDFGNHNYDRRIEDVRGDEFGIVFQSFNNMAENIEKTERDLIEANKLSEEARTKVVDILSSIKDAFLAVDNQWKFTYINNQAEQYLQQQRKDLLGKYLWEHMPPMIPGLYSALHKAMNSKTTTQLEGYYEALEIWIEAYIYPATEGISVYFRDISERKKAEEHLHYLANFDSLTGLPNRTKLMEHLNQHIKDGAAHDRMFALLFCDLDRFKVINDNLGHNVGDQLLIRAAELFSSIISPNDMVARLSGDEFVILITSADSIEKIKQIAKEIILIISEPIYLANNELYVPTSIGVSIYPTHGIDATTLLKKADTAMYYAKESGKNNFKIYSPEMDKRKIDHLRLESALHHALARGELHVYYQPFVDAKNGKIIGAEALIRWLHPDIGFIAPNEFLPIAEETGMIEDIGEMILNSACHQTRIWQDSGYDDFCISVNLSDREFKRDDLQQIVYDALQAANLTPESLELELTELIITRDINHSVTLLNEFRSMGVKLAIDDFGTGYSSLSHLKRFPANTVKIDRSFVSDVAENPSARMITDAIISLSHNLNMKVVAEGIEKNTQLRVLTEQGCDIIQGYLFSKPLSVEDFTRLLANPPNYQFVIKSLSNDQLRKAQY